MPADDDLIRALPVPPALSALAAAWRQARDRADERGLPRDHARQQELAGRLAAEVCAVLEVAPAAGGRGGAPRPTVRHVPAVRCEGQDAEAFSVGDVVYVRRDHGGTVTWDEARVVYVWRRSAGRPGAVNVRTVFGAEFPMTEPLGAPLYRPPTEGEGWANVPLTPVWGAMVSLTVALPQVRPDQLRARVTALLAAELDGVEVHAGQGAPVSARRVDVHGRAGGGIIAGNVLLDLAHLLPGDGNRIVPRTDWLPRPGAGGGHDAPEKV